VDCASYEICAALALAGAASGKDGKLEGRAARELTEIVLPRTEPLETKPEPKKKSIIEKR
jgi:hypothetical protein